MRNLIHRFHSRDLKDKLQFINNATVVTRGPLIIFACAQQCSNQAHGKPPLDQFKLLVSSISKHISIAAARREAKMQEENTARAIRSEQHLLKCGGRSLTLGRNENAIADVCKENLRAGRKRAIYQLFRFSCRRGAHPYLSRSHRQHAINNGIITRAARP
jgi:hypothetical protein